MGEGQGAPEAGTARKRGESQVMGYVCVVGQLLSPPGLRLQGADPAVP